MILPIQKNQFRKEQEDKFRDLLLQFPTPEDVHLTLELKDLLDLVISIVMVKNGWLSPRGSDAECDDYVQEVYLNANNILRNLYKRLRGLKDPEKPIKKIYSYLFVAIKNRVWDYKRSQAPFNCMWDISDFVESMQESGLIGETIDDVYTSLELFEVREEFLRRLTEIRFRFLGVEFLACHFLLDVFRYDYFISVHDMWPFLLDIPDKRRRFIFDYVDVTIKAAIYPMKHKLKGLLPISLS